MCKYMIIIHNVIILKRAIVYVLNGRKRQLHFEECHAVSLSMLLFRVSLFKKDGNTVHVLQQCGNVC